MISPTGNPFAKPELLHTGLADDIAEAEKWQREHDPEHGIAVEGLSQTVEHKLKTEASGSITGPAGEIATTLFEQRSISRLACNHVLEGLGHVEKVDAETFRNALNGQLLSWQAEGILDWAAQYKAQYGGDFWLLAVPNVSTDSTEMHQASNTFFKRQPGTESSTGFFLLNADIAPKNIPEPVYFSLVPTKPVSVKVSTIGRIKDGNGIPETIESQYLELMKGCDTSKGLPNGLEVLCFWQTLRDDGNGLDDASSEEMSSVLTLNNGEAVAWNYVSADGVNLIRQHREDFPQMPAQVYIRPFVR